jgi:DNA-binding response OmpR family regulator
MVANKILLFSADESMTRIVIHSLKEAGYKVIHASSGMDALDSIHSELPALVILDMKLPDMNSLAIIRLLRSEESDARTPVILMGAEMGEEDVLIGLEVGADLCLMETFNPLVFVARVRSLIRRTEPHKVF